MAHVHVPKKTAHSLTILAHSNRCVTSRIVFLFIPQNAELVPNVSEESHLRDCHVAKLLAMTEGVIASDRRERGNPGGGAPPVIAS